MATRDHSTITVKCPKCGNSGTAEVSTGDHPYMKSDEFQIDKLPKGFALTKHGNWRRETEVTCTSCNVAFAP